MGEIALRDWRPDDEPAVEALWERTFGRARGGQTVAWLFRPGPAGEPVRVVAEHEGRVAAHAGVVPLRFRIDGECVRGGYSVAAMTDPELQGRGLYVRVGRHLYERMEEAGFAFVAGFSNARSHRLMTGPLGRTAVRPFPWSVRPIFPGVAVRGGTASPVPAERVAGLERGRLRVRACALDEPALDALEARAGATVEIGAVRDAAFSSWRFASRPDAGYAAWCVEGPGGLAGWLVQRLLTLRGLRFAFLVDLLLDPAAPDAGPLLLRTAARHARASGAIGLSALLPGRGPIRRALQRAGFVRVPEALHPQIIRFSVRGLGRFAGSSRLVDPRAWLLSWSDTDVV